MISPQNPRYQDYQRIRRELYSGKRDKLSGWKRTEEEIDREILGILARRDREHGNGSTPPGHLPADSAAIIEQAKSTSTKRADFTNCKTYKHEILAKSAKKKLTRVPFTVSRLTEFCNRRELINQTGHDVSEWPLVVLKELTDNALDECEEAGIAPSINIEVDGDRIIIADNGRGIPAKTIASVLDYSIRISSREAYCAPTRGAQGNALKTILAMGYVLDEARGDDACCVTIIEAHGLAHHIWFSVDHIRQEPRIEHTTEPSSVARGTRITVNLPNLQSSKWEWDYFTEERRNKFLALAEAYAWLNPHLSLRLIWNGEVVIDISASTPTWSKWLPSWPTSAHWYDKSRFRRYMAAHIANRGNITVREFISEFEGLSGTAKQRAVLAETGASRVSLYDYFGRRKASSDNIAKLLAALQGHSKHIPPVHLGVIGKTHFYRMMEAAGGDPKTFTYNRSLGETKGLPRVIEFAFGIHRDGLTVAGCAPSRKVITGVNWSPGINNPFRQLGRSGDSLDAILAEVRANTSQPVIAVLHLACPRVDYTDRGKSAIVVKGDARGSSDDEEE
jgi:DNA topoisomerase VI subunit B